MAHNNPPIIPVLFYQDVANALDWLEEKFDFKRDVIFKDNEGNIIHSEMTLGKIKIMIGPLGMVEWTNTPQELGGQCTSQLYIYVNNVDAHHANAEIMGAEIVSPPEDQFYGDRIYRAVDHEGHRWIFGQKMHDVSKEDMAAATGLKVI